METTRPSSPSQSTQAAHGTSPTKHRAGHAQGAATAGDFLGMLSALNETLFASPPVLNTTATTDVGDALSLDATDDKGTSSKKLFGLLSASGEAMLTNPLNNPPNLSPPPVLNAAQATVDTSAMVSLLALQAGFSGAIQAPLNTPSTATTTNNVSLESNNPLMAAVGSRGIAVASSGGELGLVVAQPTVSASLAVGSRGVAVASSGGELGLVAQTAALDGTAETLTEQSLGGVAKKPAAFSRLLNPAAEASMARNVVASHQEPQERTTLQATLVSALQAAVSGTSAPHDLATAAGVQHQSAWGGVSPSIQAPVDLLGQEAGFSANNSQGAGRGNEGGRSSSGQNPEAGGLFGVGGTTAELGTVGEAPVFDWTGALPTEDAVAEQVSYWVNQNIQNAELTLEHNGHPVEVTVTLSGNEAHVSFRSDQNETRTLLDASVAQLRDLLESQGLSLSGMTVGDSSSQGNGGSNDGQRQGAKGARQASVQASTPKEHVGHASTVTDKTVDIFV